MTEGSKQTGLLRREKRAQVATTCYFRTDQVRKIKEMAAAQERPISYVIRAAVDLLINAALGL